MAEMPTLDVVETPTICACGATEHHAADAERCVRGHVLVNNQARRLHGVRAFETTGRLPIVAGGLNVGDVGYPLGASQALSCEELDSARQLFEDLGGHLDDPEGFCSMVRKCSSAVQQGESDQAARLAARASFRRLGDPPRAVLRELLVNGPMTSEEISTFLRETPPHYVHDPVSVQKILNALSDGLLADQDDARRWRVNPMMEGTVRQCFDPPLSLKLDALASELLSWVGEGPDHPLDQSQFNDRFKLKIAALREKLIRDHGEDDFWLSRTPSSVGGARNIAAALARLARTIP